MWEKFQSKQTVNVFRKLNTVTKATKPHLNNSTFNSPIYTFPLAGIIIAQRPIQSTNREKYFDYIIYKREVPTLAGKNHLSVHFFFHRPRLFLVSTEKKVSG